MPVHAAVQEKKHISNSGLCGICLEEILRHAWFTKILGCFSVPLFGKNDPHPPLLAIY
jgi:hypothetical protein